MNCSWVFIESQLVHGPWTCMIHEIGTRLPILQGGNRGSRSWIIRGDPGRNETQSQVALSLGSSLHVSCDSFLFLGFTFCFGKLLSTSWLPRGVKLLGDWVDSWVKRIWSFCQKSESETMTKQHLGLPTITGTILEKETKHVGWKWVQIEQTGLCGSEYPVMRGIQALVEDCRVEFQQYELN